MATQEEIERQQESLRNARTLNELQERYNLLSDEAKRIAKDTYEAQQRLLTNSEERLKNLQKIRETLEAGYKDTEEQLKALSKIYDLESGREAKHRLLTESYDTEIRLKEQILQKELEESDNIDKTLKDNEQLIKDLEKLREERRKNIILAEDEKNVNKQSADSFTSMLNLIGVKSEEQQLTMTETFFAGRFELDKFQEKAKGFFSSELAPGRIQAAIGQMIFEQTVMAIKAIDELQASIAKATGASRELSNNFISLRNSATSFGVSNKEFGESYLSLIKNSSNFTEMTIQQQQELAGVVAQMSALGVSSDVSSRNISIFTQGLGMSAKEATFATTKFSSLANSLKMSTEEVASGFAESSNTLVVYGNKAVDQFAKLSAQSKALGISVKELIGIVSKADTFQGAAEQAGKLNAILGGGLLNSYELLNASESERIDLIRNSVIESGKSFDNLSKYEKIAIANAAGISDMTMAQKLFNGEMSQFEIDKMLGKTNSLGESQAAMQQRTMDARTASEKFSIALEQMIIAVGPLISILHFLSEGFMLVGWAVSGLFNIFSTIRRAITDFIGVTEVVGEVIKFVSIWISGAIALFATWNGVLAVIAATKAAYSIVLGFFNTQLGINNLLSGRAITTYVVLALALTILYYAITRRGSPPFYLLFGVLALGIALSGEMINKYKSAYLALGAAILMIGTGAFMAFYGLEGFATALSALNPAQLNTLAIVIGVLTIALLGLFAGLGFLVYTGLGLAAAGVLLAFGAAMLMAGAGAALLGVGLSLVADAFGALTSNITGLLILPALLQVLTLSIIIFSGSIGLLALSFGALFLTLASIGTNMLFFALPIAVAIGMVASLGAALNEISTEKSIALKTTVDSIKDLTVTSKDLTAESVNNLEKVVEQIHKYNIEATINKALNVTAPFKELIDAITGQTGAVTAAASANRQTNVVMKLNEREFGRAVVDVLNDKGTTNTIIKKA